MPHMEQAYRRQRAVLWEATGATDEFSQPTLSAPVEIIVRWVNKRKEMIDPQGNKVSVDATAVVNQAVPIGSEMWLAPLVTDSALDQWYGTGSAGQDSGVMQVIADNFTPDIKNRVNRRTVGLMKFKDSP